MTMQMIERLRASRAALVDETRSLIDAAEAETRDLSDTERRSYDEAVAAIDDITARIADLERHEERTAAAAHVPTRHVGSSANPWGEAGDTRTRALQALERAALDDLSATRADTLVRTSDEFAARFLVTSDPAYERAFLKLLSADATAGPAWTDEERAAWQRAVVVSTNTAGGFMSPTHLDPTIHLTSAGSGNVLRDLATVVELRQGDTWRGITSAGVTASWDPEMTEVSDDSPAIAEAAIPVHKASAFVEYSVEAGQDLEGLAVQLRRLFADAKDNLEGAAFMTGSGTNQPTGIFTALDANTNVELLTTTAGTVGIVDIQAVYRALPQRFRRNAAWLMNPLWSLGIKTLGTAVSASYSGDLTTGGPERILGHPVVEADDAPAVVTTTARDNVLIFGDFRDYIIVDKPGFNVELIPHLFGTTNNRPIGARGMYAWWRTGGAAVVDNGFRLLQDRTSA